MIRIKVWDKRVGCFFAADGAGAEVWGKCIGEKWETTNLMLKNTPPGSEDCDPLPLQISLHLYHYLSQLGLSSALQQFITHREKGP